MEYHEAQEKIALIGRLESMLTQLRAKYRLPLNKEGVPQIAKGSFSPDNPIYKLMDDIQQTINQLQRPEINTGVTTNLDDLYQRFIEIISAENTKTN